jgi:threonyl-tRNA synthetase
MEESSAAGRGKTGKSPAAPPTIGPDSAYLEAVTQKRIALFQAIQARQALERLHIAGDPIR